MPTVLFNYDQEELALLQGYITRLGMLNEGDLGFDTQIIDLRIEMYKKLILPYFDTFFGSFIEEISRNGFKSRETVALLKERIPVFEESSVYSEALAAILFVEDEILDEGYFIQVAERFASEGLNIPGYLAIYSTRNDLSKV